MSPMWLEHIVTVVSIVGFAVMGVLLMRERRRNDELRSSRLADRLHIVDLNRALKQHEHDWWVEGQLELVRCRALAIVLGQAKASALTFALVKLDKQLDELVEDHPKVAEILDGAAQRIANTVICTKHHGKER